MRIPGITFWTPKPEIARVCAPYLEPGERIQHQLIGFKSIMEPHWAVVVTDRAVLVLSPGVMRPGFSRWVVGADVQRLLRQLGWTPSAARVGSW